VLDVRPANRAALEVAEPAPTRASPRAAPVPARAVVLPGLLLLAGSFLLFMALLLPLVVAPVVRLLPLDRFTVTSSEGSGTYTSPRTGDLVATDDLRHTTTVRGDVERGSADVAVWEVFATTEDVAPDVDAADRVLDELQETIALDRRTARAVACCGEDPPHDGLTLRFPLDAGPGPHDLWDPHLRAARPAAQARSDRLGDLDVAVYVQRVEPTPVASGGAQGTLVYAADREVWVEPATGLIVRVDENLRWTLEGPGVPSRPYRSADLTWSAASVGEAAAEAQALRTDLRRLTVDASVAALTGGAVLLAAGIRATARLRRAGGVRSGYAPRTGAT